LILIYFCLRNREEISHRKIITGSPYLNNVPRYLCKTTSDAACRMFDHTHNTSTGSCQSNPLITGEDYYNFC